MTRESTGGAGPPGAPKRRRKLGNPRGRRPGRPQSAGGDLRGRLLDAAVSRFSREGVAATPLRAIANEAGVTAALLHYYFGDKGQLQQAVVAERVLPAFLELGKALAAEDDDVPALVAGFVDGMGATVARHPWLPALWVREVLCEGGALRDTLFEEITPQLPLALASRFARAQARGDLDPALDPRLLVVSLVGLTLFPLAGAATWRRMFDADDSRADGSHPGGVDFADLQRHTLLLLRQGLRPA